MALPMPIPPWLVSRPAEHAEAAQAGLREGLAAAQIWAQANAESARLAEAEKRSNLAAKLREEEIQQKSIYEAQANATDRAKIQAAIGMAQAKNQQTQATAAEKAQQWAQDYALNVTKATDTRKHQAALEEQARINEASLKEHRDRQDAAAAARATAPKAFRLDPMAQVDDDLLKQKMAMNNAALKSAIENNARQPEIDKIVEKQNELLMERKQLRRKQMAKDAAGTTANGLKYSVTPRQPATEPDDEQE